MSDLVAFLRARLDEDEAAARESFYEGQRWLTEEEGIYRWPADELVHTADRKADARHIARHDPARVLREVEADRMILAGHAAAHAAYREARSLNPDDPRRVSAAHQVLVWERVLKIRAAVYAGHPDYDEAWKP